jgi:hypothetical protein
MCSGRVGRSCSTSDTRRVNLVTNPVISHEWGEDWEVFTTNGTYPWTLVTQILHNGNKSVVPLLTLWVHLRIFSGVRVTRSLVLCVRFVDRCLSLCTFSFGHCVVCSSIYRFWLPLWYLQTLLPIFLHSTLFHKNAYQITMFANDVNMLWEI